MLPWGSVFLCHFKGLRRNSTCYILWMKNQKFNTTKSNGEQTQVPQEDPLPDNSLSFDIVDVFICTVNRSGRAVFCLCRVAWQARLINTFPAPPPPPFHIYTTQWATPSGSMWGKQVHYRKIHPFKKNKNKLDLFLKRTCPSLFSALQIRLAAHIILDWQH